MVFMQKAFVENISNVVCNFQWKAVIALKDQKEIQQPLVYIAAVLLWNIPSMFNQKENISATLLMHAIERSSVSVGIIVLIVFVFHTVQSFLCSLFHFCVFSSTINANSLILLTYFWLNKEI